MIKLRKRSLAAIALTASAVILGTTLPASAATGADGFSILYASQGDTAMAHKCGVVGSADGYQAVVCADIVTSEVTPSDYYSYGQIWAYCQKGSGSTAVNVQCAQVEFDGTFADAAEGVRGTVGSWVCGHQYGACSTSRNELSMYNSRIQYTSNSGCGSDPNTNHDVWTNVDQGAEIELPVSDKWVYLESGSGANDGSNFSTGHYYVCA
jgi:hypothetical protein